MGTSGKRVTPDTLGRELKRLGVVAGDEFELFLGKLTIDAFRELITRSARETGYLRSRWSVTTDTPPETPTKGITTTFYTPARYPAALKILTGDIIILFNNTEYAIYLEEGTENMRSQPMVEPTRLRVETRATRLANILSKKVIG